MVNVIGLGYIGFPTAIMLAANNIEVIGTDLNESLIEQLKQGKHFFDEEGMEDVFKQAVENGIRFQTTYQSSEMYIVAVPTPYMKKDKKLNPGYVVNAVERILEVCPQDAVIIIESTISPGTIDRFVRPLLKEKNKDKYIKIVHAPERIIPGKMIYELKHNSRTLGADDALTGERVKKIYQSFCKGEIIITDIRTAEMSKVVENTYRDINIAFANELAKICRSDNLDVYEVIKIANMHPRVNILTPGPGVGGHCISVDPWFLVGDYPGLANIILAARKINASMPEFVLGRISEIMEENKITDVTKVGFYGLTYKENVDDIRESPTLQLLECMKRHLAVGVKVYDPYISCDVVENQYHSLDSFINDVDIVVIMVAHQEILDNMSKIKNKIVFDTRNICTWDKVYKL